MSETSTGMEGSRCAGRLNFLRRSQSEVMDLFMDAGIKGNLEASDVLAALDRFARR
jgi:hypothetical protein